MKSSNDYRFGFKDNNMKKIRIVHIQVLPLFSGVQKAMYDILVRLDRNQYEISVICQCEGELTQLLKKCKIEYILVPELKRSINIFFDIRAFLKLYNIFKKGKYDIVHTHSSKPGFLGRLAAKQACVKGIIHTVQGFAFHSQSSKLTKFIVGALEKIAGYAADKVVFVNDNDRISAKNMKLISAHKMLTIYNGIELNYGRNNGNGREKELQYKKEAKSYVGMVARLWKQKAPHDYIHSIFYVLQKKTNTKFLVIGDGPLEKELKELCTNLGISKNVDFLGWRKDVPDLLKKLDVFVLPSLWEGLPVSILEAMALGKPVVATDIKGNNELVVHGKTGFLVPPHRPDKIAESIISLLDDEKMATEMGEKGYLRLKEKFDINTTVKQINLEYKKLLNEDNSSNKL